MGTDKRGTPTNLTSLWTQLDPQFEPVWGADTHIGVRYSHCAVAYRGKMIVTHGYFYNHKYHRPAWQSDTWQFDPTKNASWTRIHAPWKPSYTPVAEQGADDPVIAPSPRYSATAVVYADTMLMFGGDDGGHLLSPMNYIFGAYFDDLWAFDLIKHVWRKHPKPEGAKWPAKRALHGATLVNGRMHIFGGLGISDHWAMDLRTREWARVSATSAQSAWEGIEPTYRDAYPTGPGGRHAVAMAAAGDGRSLYLFGGSRHGKTGFKPKVFDDLWRFQESGLSPESGELQGTWTRLGSRAQAKPRPWPGPRGHHSLVTLGAGQGADVGVLLFGGALCIPGCSCYNDSWTWLPGAGEFAPVTVSSPPIWRYRQSLVADSAGALLLFGGESYRPYMYHNSVSRLQLAAGWLPAQITQAKQRAASAASAAGGSALPAWRAEDSVLGREPGPVELRLAAEGGGGGGGGGAVFGVLALLLALFCLARRRRSSAGYAKASNAWPESA